MFALPVLPLLSRAESVSHAPSVLNLRLSPLVLWRLFRCLGRLKGAETRQSSFYYQSSIIFETLTLCPGQSMLQAALRP
jgi:hypothetical protein